MKLELKDTSVEFEVVPIKILERDIENVFKSANRTLLYKYEKAWLDQKDRLHKVTKKHFDLYAYYHAELLGIFIWSLKNAGNSDYKNYLNKYGDSIYCTYRIERHLNDKGIYCYIVDDKIMYLGRCRKKLQIKNQ